MVSQKQYREAEKRLKDAKTISCRGETYQLGEVNNMPEGKIDIIHAVANLVYWEFRGWDVQITY